MRDRDFYVGIDFDNTLAHYEHNQYPEVGEPIKGAVEWCKRFVEMGAKLILHTARDGSKDGLEKAVIWCQEHVIELFGVNENPDCPSDTLAKPYCDVYVDDRGFGCPRLFRLHLNGDLNYWYVRWEVVGPCIRDDIEKKLGSK